MDYAHMNMTFTNTLIMNSVIEEQVRSRSTGTPPRWAGGKRTATTTRKTASTASSGISPSVFSYTATPAQRTAYRDAYIANLAKTNPTLATSLRAQLSRYDYNTIYNSLLSGTGLASNNLADALTAYTVLGWMVVNGQTSDPPMTHIAGTRRQWAAALSGTDLATNAASRRSTAEELKIKTVLLHAGWKDAQKLGQTAAYATTVDGLFQQQMKLRLRSVALTPAGLRTRG